MGTAFPRVPAQLHPWSYDAITGATYSTALKTTARAYVQMVGYWNPIASQQGNAGDGCAQGFSDRGPRHVAVTANWRFAPFSFRWKAVDAVLVTQSCSFRAER